MEPQLPPTLEITTNSTTIAAVTTTSSDKLLSGAEEMAQRLFGFPSLYRHQQEILSHVFSGRDCLAVVPTGSGKSLCYVLPACLRPGITVVISPLIALIRDQVQKFSALGISCAALDSLQSDQERKDVWSRLEAESLCLLYVSPERLAMASFRERLLRITKIGLVAIDEAHCISHWGYHFRPDYRKIGTFLEDFGEVQKIALTATATRKVRDDIAKTLKLRLPARIMSPIKRSNLNIKIFNTGGKDAQLQDLLHGVLSAEGTGIVYAPTRKRVDEIQMVLTNAGVNVVSYHAGMTAELRKKSQTDFLADKCQVVVATSAFGMGIDKKNIRFVFHAGMPASLEQYVQEIGRAGRDGKPAKCYLFYGGRDFYLQKFMIEKSFPEPEVVRSLLREARVLLARTNVCDERLLVNTIARSMPAENMQDIRAYLQIVYKEGLLIREYSRNLHQNFNADGQVRMGLSHETLDSGYWQQYVARKREQFYKLGCMHDFVTSSLGRWQILEKYFAD